MHWSSLLSLLFAHLRWPTWPPLSLPSVDVCSMGRYGTSNSPKSRDQLTLVNQAEQSTPVALQFSDAVSVHLSASDELRES